MIIKNLDYHKVELHKVAKQIKQIKKDSGLPKRSGDEMILYRLLHSYRYWVTRTKTGKNIHRAKYARKRIKVFYMLMLSKTFHQTVIVMLMENQKANYK